MPVASARKVSLSIFQMMKLVIFFAVAFASIAPEFHLWQAGVVERGSARGLAVAVIFGATLVPLEWAGLSLLLVRRGHQRDRLILGLLLCSALVALVTACWTFVDDVVPAFRYVGAPPSALDSLLMASVVILVLAAACAFLGAKLVRKSFNALMEAPAPELKRNIEGITLVVTRAQYIDSQGVNPADPELAEMIEEFEPAGRLRVIDVGV